MLISANAAWEIKRIAWSHGETKAFTLSDEDYLQKNSAVPIYKHMKLMKQRKIPSHIIEDLSRLSLGNGLGSY